MTVMPDRTAAVLQSAAALEFGDALPRHEQIENWLVALITSGTVEVGDRLPGERELAAVLAVSRMTLRQAIGALERRGMICKVLGRNGGTQIARPTIEVDLTGLPGFSQQIRAAHQRADSIVLCAELQSASRQVGTALRIPARSPVYYVERVRSANGTPLALERSYFPAQPFPGFLDLSLDGSLYEILAGFGRRPTTAQEYLRPVVADTQHAQLLAVEIGDPLMRIERLAECARGEVVELSYDLFRSDLVRIGVRSHLHAEKTRLQVETHDPRMRDRFD